jgi:hypothetical protein
VVHSSQQKIRTDPLNGSHPGLVRFMMFVDPPGSRPRTRPPAGNLVRPVRRCENLPGHRNAACRLARLGADSFEGKVTINAMALARLIAKIGHSFAVAELGFDAFEELYVAHLIGAEAQDWNYWVGGYDRGPDVPPRELHELGFLRRGGDLSVIVHLLVPYCPRYCYEVIVGRLRPNVVIIDSEKHH